MLWNRVRRNAFVWDIRLKCTNCPISLFDKWHNSGIRLALALLVSKTDKERKRKLYSSTSNCSVSHSKTWISVPCQLRNMLNYKNNILNIFLQINTRVVFRLLCFLLPVCENWYLLCQAFLKKTHKSFKGEFSHVTLLLYSRLISRFVVEDINCKHIKNTLYPFNVLVVNIDFVVNCCYFHNHTPIL